MHIKLLLLSPANGEQINYLFKNECNKVLEYRFITFFTYNLSLVNQKTTRK